MITILMRNFCIGILTLFLSSQISVAQEILPWDDLDALKYVQEDGLWIAQFEQGVIDMDGVEVTIEGFMMPLDQAPKQKKFLMSSSPSDCMFCMPGGAVVEVKATEGIEFSYEPISVSGKFQLDKDDIYGLFYRLIGAKENTE